MHADEVDLNTATAEELSHLPGIGPDKSWDLLHRRPFRTWEDVLKVPGFDPETVDVMKRAGAVLQFQQNRKL